MGKRRGEEDRLRVGVSRLEQALDGWESAASRDTWDPERLRRLADRLQRLADAGSRASDAEAIAAVRARQLIGPGPAMQAILATVRRIGPRPSSVLIQGESGTGKELVARAIHDAGPRRLARFVAVDCGCVPETLIESELFGHRRGAFTGALADRTGLIEEADGGTLFLDELANASHGLQTRLLRVLQEGEIRRVGENRARRVDLRVIGATSGDLKRLVATGRFREDLYYRLHVISLELPPLRRRRADIPDLAGHLLARCCSRHGLATKQLTAAAMEILLLYAWPGNVRELENVIERTVLLAHGPDIGPDALPAALLDALLETPPEPAADETPKTGEQRLIERALLECHGDKTRAARLIGWHKAKLYRRLVRYGIPFDFGRGRRSSTAPPAVPVSRSSPDTP